MAGLDVDTLATVVALFATDDTTVEAVVEAVGVGAEGFAVAVAVADAADTLNCLGAAAG